MKRYFRLNDTIVTYSDSESKKIKGWAFLFWLRHREYDLEKVVTLRNPSKRFPMKEEYCDSMIDLVFEDKTLTITGHARLPGSVEFVKKVAGFA